MAVSIGDINGDGAADLVTANMDSSNISVLLGNGNESFRAQTCYPGGTSAKFATVSDVNGDGISDIIAVNTGSKNLSFLAGNGSTASGLAAVSGRRACPGESAVWNCSETSEAGIKLLSLMTAFDSANHLPGTKEPF